MWVICPRCKQLVDVPIQGLRACFCPECGFDMTIRPKNSKSNNPKKKPSPKPVASVTKGSKTSNKKKAPDAKPEQDDWMARAELAESPFASPDALRMLARDDHWSVRCAVAGNPNTPYDVILELQTDKMKDVREKALKSKVPILFS